MDCAFYATKFWGFFTGKVYRPGYASMTGRNIPVWLLLGTVTVCSSLALRLKMSIFLFVVRAISSWNRRSCYSLFIWKVAEKHTLSTTVQYSSYIFVPLPLRRKSVNRSKCLCGKSARLQTIIIKSRALKCSLSLNLCLAKHAITRKYHFQIM